MDFKNLMRVARRRWRSIAAMFLLALSVSFAFSLTTTPVYESQTRIYITADSTSGQGNDIGANYFLVSQIKSYAQLANHAEVLKRTAESLDDNVTAADLAGRISATALPESLILQVTTHDTSPERAQKIAQAHAIVLVSYLEELETPKGDENPQIKATLTDPATYNPKPIAPRTLLNTVVAALLGLVLGCGLALVRELLDNTIHSMDEMEKTIDAPVMASVGIDPEIERKPLLTDLSGFSIRGEAFRVLRTNLQFLDLDSEIKSLVITSATAGEGKTTTSANLAIALAQTGRRVLVVDGDLRRPRIARLMGLEGAVGLTTVLVGRTELDASIQKHKESGVYVLASGPTPPNPSEILQSRAARDLILQLRDKFDAVIIDAPPILPVADATILATICDGAILVTRHGKTPRDHVQTAAQRLRSVNAKLLGAVVNFVPKQAAGGYYYYYYYAEQETRPKTGGRRKETTK